MGGERCWRCYRNKNVWVESSQLDRKTIEAFCLFGGKAIFQNYALAIDKAEIAQSLPKGVEKWCFFLFASRMPKHPNSRNLTGLLRADIEG